jgi:hypothetical protein
LVSPRKLPTGRSPRPSPAANPGRNADFPWDEFDSSWYMDHKYETVRDDDRRIVEIVGDFVAAAGLPEIARGVDVGSGTNLYPMFAMLPRCGRITLVERSSANIGWLRAETNSYGDSWQSFWQILAGRHPVYRSVVDPRATTRERVEIRRDNIFQLAEATWDIGTMFFVAESITADHAEFELATRRFVHSLRPGAPFAAAFMRNSVGYEIGRQRFPAVAVDEGDIAGCLRDIAHSVAISTITSTKPLRDGYEGMIVVTGRSSVDARPVRTGPAAELDRASSLARTCRPDAHDRHNLPGVVVMEGR